MTGRLAMLSVAILMCLAATGCVHRRVTLRSDPPGARVFVGEREIGHTPASFDFTWYGTEEVTLLKDGYEPETQHIKIPTPWYQVPPLDFVTDNLLPLRIKDKHDFTFQLRPRVLVPDNELLQRGNALRSEAQLGQ